MDITTLGVDIAKNVFQVHGVDHAGKKVINKTITRNKLPEFMSLGGMGKHPRLKANTLV